MTNFKANLRSKAGLVLMTALAMTGLALPAAGQTKKRPKYTLPADTVIRVRMNDKISSKDAVVGSKFTTTVVTPVYAKGVQVIPAGAIVGGTVTHVERASRKSNAGTLTVTFTSIKMPNGATRPISAALAASDESQIEGKSSKKRNTRFVGRGMVVGGLINGAAGVATGGLIGAARGLIKKGEEAQVDSGTEFNIMLNQSILLTAFP